MSSRKKRPTAEYLAAAKRLAKLIPSLKKYRRAKDLTPQQKSAIARREKQMRYADHLIPLTPKQAKKFAKQLFAPGIHAIQLRNTAPDAKIRLFGRDFIVTSNGRDFLYWRLPIRAKRNPDKTLAEDKSINKRSQRLLKEAAEKALTNIRGAFPVEQIAELAQKAFKKIKVKQIFLWGETGRVGEGFHTFDEFVQWLYESYSQYRNVERWVNGIAIQI